MISHWDGKSESSSGLARHQFGTAKIFTCAMHSGFAINNDKRVPMLIA
jgi:hypothetical protein